MLLLALKFHLPYLGDAGRYDRDVCQHVFWTARFSDPGLFPEDPLVRFISSSRCAPPGYRGLFAVGARLCDPLLFATLLGLAVSVATGMLALRLGARCRGAIGGFLCALAVGLALFDNLRCGLARGFGHPLKLLCLDALMARQAARCGVSMVLGALFYPPVTFWLGDRSYSRSSCGLLTKNTLEPLLAGVLLGVILRRRFRAWRELAGLFLAGGALFLVAHALLFRLYLPGRYTLYSWPLALLLLAALNAVPLLEAPLARLPRALAGWRGAAVLIVGVSLLLGAVLMKEGRTRGPERRRVLEAVAALPKDALIAGVPCDLDDIPLSCRRSVLASRELALPYYTAYYALVRERIFASLEILMASDPETARRIAGAYGVTHVLVLRDLYDPKRGPALLMERYRQRLRALPESGDPPLWIGGRHPFPVLHSGERWELVAIPPAQSKR